MQNQRLNLNPKMKNLRKKSNTFHKKTNLLAQKVGFFYEKYLWSLLIKYAIKFKDFLENIKNYLLLWSKLKKKWKSKVIQIEKLNLLS